MKEIYRKMEDGTLQEISGKISIIDGLTSTSSTDALSAKQGKILNDKIDAIPKCPFPIGGIYISVGNTDPSTHWAGTTWSKLSDGTFLMADSTGQKTAVAPELPNIAGSIGMYRGTVEAHNGVFKNSYQGTEWWKEMTDPTQAGNDCRIDFAAAKGQIKADGSYEKIEDSVYKNGGKIIPHGTIKVVMWERIA